MAFPLQQVPKQFLSQHGDGGARDLLTQQQVPASLPEPEARQQCHDDDEWRLGARRRARASRAPNEREGERPGRR
ncbi:MAG TPA: hypothetical protein VHE82_14210 [Gemmatimonadaceae bacterium]|nr:hypothetical protein [Gemmatimonadaceae bacterium]